MQRDLHEIESQQSIWQVYSWLETTPSSPARLRQSAKISIQLGNMIRVPVPVLAFALLGVQSCGDPDTITVLVDGYQTRKLVFEGFSVAERVILDGYRRKTAEGLFIRAHCYNSSTKGILVGGGVGRVQNPIGAD